MEERIDNVQFLAQNINYDVPVYIDLIDNKANMTFGAIPERLVILLDDKIEYIGGTGPFNYSIPDMTKHLEKVLKRH